MWDETGEYEGSQEFWWLDKALYTPLERAELRHEICDLFASPNCKRSKGACTILAFRPDLYR